MAGKQRLLFGTTLEHFDTFDMALLKMSLMAFTLFVVSAWVAFADWVVATSWAWFLAAWIILAVRPVMKSFRK